MKCNYGKPGDIFSTAFLVFCPTASYSITIYCVVKLYLFLLKSKGNNMRSAISKQVMQRQKSILATICIQALVPVLTYTPLFISILFVDNSWGGTTSEDSEWLVCEKHSSKDPPTVLIFAKNPVSYRSQ
ncbi:hypothetical protein COOONC_02203 [Cooperia oncophora]